MSGYGQFCPVARASEIFAERWTPLILREIMAGRYHFSEIHKGLHSISPSMLGRRLRSLERAGVIETGPNPTGRGSTYHLTESGRQLAEVVRGLGIWGQQWLELQPEHLDSDFLMWRILKHLPPDRLPARPHVVRFEFRGAKKRYWLVLRRDDPDLCYSDPGFGDDLVIRTQLECLVRVYLGQLSLADARRAGLLEIEGPRELAQGVEAWFPVSGFAPHARAFTYEPRSRSFVRSDGTVRLHEARVIGATAR
jgi:DNA-binding HxlR family transcriptional regulator